MTSPEFSSLLESLFNLQRHGIKLGLEHTVRLLDYIGNPQKDLTMIHVAGTNGKGSTCAQLASMLKASGQKVGLYTSPHLIRFNERIRVNGQPISDEEIIAFMAMAESEIEEIESTFFEVSTAMALYHFKTHHVDVAVIETGLGGRLDSTNVIEPVVTVITHISMDHMDILGKDLEKIAREKAGIIKKNVPVIVADQTPKVKTILQQTADEKDAPIFDLAEISEILPGTLGTEFQYNGKKYFTSLIGEYQAVNGALAIECVNRLDPEIPNKVIRNGLKKVVWPGRIQQLNDRIYYDVAHNEDGVEFLIQTIRNIFPGEPLIGLFCLKGDKALDRLVQKLVGQFSKLFVTTDQNGLLMGEIELSKKLKSEGLENQPIDSVSSGLIQLKQNIDVNGVGIIFGSHYIADEVFAEFEISFDSGII